MKPNLFQFATSELSQDAVLCWLLSWADIKYEKNHPHLHAVGKDFLNLIYQRANAETPKSFSSVEVRKQDGSVDILCIVNGEMAILIEDKVGTKEHSDQLARYKDHVLKNHKFTGENIISVYIQTGDQDDFSEVAKHGYLVLERRDLLVLLKSQNAKAASAQSDVLGDFTKHLQQWENRVQSYLTLPPSIWTSYSLMGFYTHLKKLIKDGSWGYVPNQTGGFIGFWWHFQRSDNCTIYLQLEQGKFCFKISVNEVEKCRELRGHWHHQIILRCPDHNIKASRPRRFGSGWCMTVAILDQEFPAVRSNGLIDMEETIKIIHSAQSVLDACISTESSPPSV